MCVVRSGWTDGRERAESPLEEQAGVQAGALPEPAGDELHAVRQVRGVETTGTARAGRPSTVDRDHEPV